MDSRNRASSIALKGLLNRQLSSISETLAKASKRRDEELQQRSSSKAQTVRSPTNLSLTSDTEVTASDSGGSVPQKGSNADDLAFEAIELKEAQAGNPTRGSLVGDHASDDEDPKTLLARLEQGEPSTTTTTETELQQILALNDELGLEDNAYAMADLKKMLAEMSQDNEYDGDDVSSMLANLDEASTRDESDEAESTDPGQMLSEVGRSGFVVNYEIVSSDDVSSMLASPEEESMGDKGTRSGEAESNDPKQMLAEFGQTEPVVNDETVSRDDVRSMLAKLEEASSEVEGTRSGEAESTELQQMLAEFGHTSPVMGDVSISSDGDDELRLMLAEFERRTSFGEELKNHTGSQYDVNPKAMLAEFEQQTPQLGQVEGEEDLEALHGRLTSILSPGGALRSPTHEHTECDKHELHFDTAMAPYIMAIHLETADSSWEKALGWTTYLFSSGLNGYKACQEKDRIVSQANEELENIIQQVLEEETVHQTVENKARLPRRLIVSNIAADAGEEDLREFFYSFRFAIDGIKMLPDREPTNRSRTAYVDMVGRQAAIRASYMRGSIFGLVPDMKLALENEE